MKRNLDNFTRGSQLLGHFGFMFAAGLKGPLIIAAVVISGTSWWTLSSALTDYELYLIWMRIYAAAYGFMEFSPDKLVTVKTVFGGTMQLPIGMLASFPPVVRAWNHMTDLVASAAWRSALFLIPAFVLFYGFAARFGSKAKDRKFVRGAQLFHLRELVRRLRRHNRQKRNLERNAAMGWKWRLKHTMAGPITAPEAARMAESVRAVFNVNAKALELLPTEGPHFSVREWIEQSAENPAGRGSILFISSRYVDMSVTSQLLTLWLDTAMNTLMTSARSNEVTCWFFIDELGALHRLPALEKGLQTARNFGGAIVLGLHAYAKLKEVYGENMAATLASLARTKLILSVADKETAIWCSDVIGHEEVIDTDVGYSYGVNNARDAVSLTRRTTIRPLRMPEELMNMKSLEGYIKFPEGFPAAPVKLRPVNRPKVADAFIVRGPNRPLPPAHLEAPVPQRPKPGGQSGEGASTHTSTSDDGGGKSTLRHHSVSKQGELAFDNALGEAAWLDRPVASEAARQLGTDASGRPAAGGVTSTDPERAKGDQAPLEKGRHGHPADQSKGLASPHGNNRPALKPGPKSGARSSDRALRQNASPGRQAAKDGAERSGEPNAKSDGPKVNDPSSRKGRAPASPPRSSDARRLLNENGTAERSEPPKDTRDLGDLEI